MNKDGGVYIQFFVSNRDKSLNSAEIECMVDDFVSFNTRNGFNVSGIIVPEEDLEDFEVVEEGQVCPACGGSGVREESEEERLLYRDEWNDLYAPVAQKEERFSSKEQAEGSNPSGSANDKENLKQG